MSAAGGTAGGRGRSSPRGGKRAVVNDALYNAAGSEDDEGRDVAEAFVDGDDQTDDQDELLRCCACGEMVAREPELLLLPCLHACCTACFPQRPAACPLCRVEATAAAASESPERVSVLLSACSRAAAAAERQCTLCWQSGAAAAAAAASTRSNGAASSAASAFASTVPAEHECRECGLRLCSHCAVWHSRFKRSHVVTAFGDASSKEADAISVPLGGNRAADTAAAAPSVQPRRWSSRPLAELRLAAAKLAAMQQRPVLPVCTSHGLPCDALCFTCERLACRRCLSPLAADAIGQPGAADGGCVGHRVAAVASGETAEYARRARTSLEAAMSHVERCLNASFSLFGPSEVSSVNGSSAAAAAADCSNGGAAPALLAARAADLQRLQANKRLALERVARAHRTAERLLLDAYDRLERETPAQRSSVLLMSRQLRRARCYAELLGCADDACRTQQQQHSAGRDGCDRGGDDDEGDDDDDDDDEGDDEGHDIGNSGNDSSDLFAAAFLDEHGVLLTCVRELLRGSSVAAAPADGFVIAMMDSVGCEGATGAEWDRSGGCRAVKTREPCEAIESLLLQQWLRPAIFPSTETETTSDEGAHSGDCLNDAWCDPTASGGLADDVSDSYRADDDVASANDVGSDSSPGGSAISAAVAAPTGVTSTAIVTTDQSFRKNAVLDDADVHEDGGSGCVAADLSDERQLQQPSLLTHCVLCEQLLDDPMLLACLHSCCRRCADAVADMSAAAREANGAQNAAAYSRIACPLCGVVCQASSLKPNRLATALLSAAATSQHHLGSDPSALQTLQPPTLLCDVCSDLGEKRSARLTCFVCKQCYCETCELRHRALNARHAVGPVAAAAAAIITQQQQPLSYAVTVAQSCQRSGHDMFCIDCDALRCHFCGKQCIERRHDLAAVNGQRMVSLAHEAADRLRRSAADVAILADQASIAATSCAAKLPSVDGAIATASSDAGLLLVASRARAAESYCSRLLSSPDVALVLDQMSAVTSCLETLRSEFDARLSGILRCSRSAGYGMTADCRSIDRKQRPM